MPLEPDRCTRRSAKHAACAGFSLVELSVVIAIISAIAVMGLELTAHYMNRTAYKVTQERIEAIDKAIVRYTKTYNKLPCPSLNTLVLGDACYGKEANGQPSGCGNTRDVCRANTMGTTTLFAGNVPVRDLGLPMSYMLDGYGSRIMYVATANQVYNRNYHATINFDREPDQIAIRSGKLDSTCGGASVCQDRGNASFLVLSYGADRRGGATASAAGTSQPCDMGAALARYDGMIDTANCRFGNNIALTRNGTTVIAPAIPMNVFYDSRFNAGDQEASHFDDIVRWRPKGNL